MKTESFTFLEDKQWMRIEPSSSPTASKSTGINIKYVAVGLIGLPKEATLCSFLCNTVSFDDTKGRS